MQHTQCVIYSHCAVVSILEYIWSCLRVIKHDLCARWNNTVCFLRAAAGSVCREEHIHSVVVGHHDGDQRNDVCRINNLALLIILITFILLIHLCVTKFLTWAKPLKQTVVGVVCSGNFVSCKKLKTNNLCYLRYYKKKESTLISNNLYVRLHHTIDRQCLLGASF